MTQSPHDPLSDNDVPPTCRAYVAVVHAVLDRERSPADMANGHAAACDSCRELAAAARAFLGAYPLPLSVPPPGLTDRIVAGVAQDTRVRTRRRVGAVMAFALTASVLGLGVYLSSRGGGEPNDAPVAVVTGPPAPGRPAPPVEPPRRVEDQIADAGSALAAITARVADRAFTPTRHLVLPAETVALPREVLPPMSEPFAESLAAVPQAAQASLEPVAGTTRRAVNLFLRDFGMGPPAKPNS